MRAKQEFTIAGLTRKQFSAEIASWKGRILPGSKEWSLIETLFRDGKAATPECAAKRSARAEGMCCVEIRRNLFGHPELWIERAGRGWTDVSWAECFAPSSKQQRLAKAFRFTVDHQILEFRRDVPRPSLCPILGVPLASDAQIDHEAPITFASLQREFIRLFGEPEVCSPEGVTGTVFKDSDLQRRWQDFHREHSKLRWVSKRANLSAGCK